MPAAHQLLLLQASWQCHSDCLAWQCLLVLLQQQQQEEGQQG
jgi:hypothetical protein